MDVLGFFLLKKNVRKVVKLQNKNDENKKRLTQLSIYGQSQILQQVNQFYEN